MPQGVRLLPGTTLRALIASAGGTAPAHTLDLHLERILSGRDATTANMRSSDLAVVAHRRHLPREPGPGLFLVAPKMATSLRDHPVWVHPYPLWTLAGLLTTHARASSFDGPPPGIP